MKLYGNEKIFENKAVRSVIIQSCIAFLVALIPSILICGYLIKVFQGKAPFNVDFIYLVPEGAVIAAIKVAIFLAIYLSAPFILYKFARLKLNIEKKLLIILLSFGFLLFTLGILFAYYALIPSMLFFILGMSQNLGDASFSITSYVDFCLKAVIFSGMISEFPVLLVIFAKTDLIKSAKLAKHWKEAAIGALILSIILTYSELFTLIFFAVIILLIYGIVMTTARMVEKL